MLLLFETEQVPAEVRVKVIITWVQYDMKALLPFIQRRQTFFYFLMIPLMKEEEREVTMQKMEPKFFGTGII